MLSTGGHLCSFFQMSVTAAAGCKGGHVYVSTFNAGTISNCTFDQGSQTIVSGAGAGGICASEARYTTAGSSACYLEQYTTASVTASTCDNSSMQLTPAFSLARNHPFVWRSCRFIANSQVGAGGVLGIFTGLTTSVTGCNFTANSSPNGIGSALFAVVLQTLSVANNTFTDNGGKLSNADV